MLLLRLGKEVCKILRSVLHLHERQRGAKISEWAGRRAEFSTSTYTLQPSPDPLRISNPNPSTQQWNYELPPSRLCLLLFLLVVQDLLSNLLHELDSIDEAGAPTLISQAQVWIWFAMTVDALEALISSVSRTPEKTCSYLVSRAVALRLHPHP